MNMSSQTDNILVARRLAKVYNSGPARVEVLRDINLSIRRGEIVVIMGPSGVGKSTLLNLVGTLDVPSSGEILIDNEAVHKFDEDRLASFRNRNIGFIFQFHYLMPEFTALENVLIPRMIRSSDWRSQEGDARAMLEEVGLGERLHHRPNQLSGWEQQRVAIARALINRPALVLADEPTGDLDRTNSEALYSLILDLNRKYQQTFIIVTHDESCAEKAHRILYLLDGIVDKEEVCRPLG